MLRFMVVIFNQRTVLNLFFKEFKQGKCSNDTVSLEEHDTLKNLIAILDTIQEFTEKLSSENKITASMILPLCSMVWMYD